LSKEKKDNLKGSKNMGNVWVNIDFCLGLFGNVMGCVSKTFSMIAVTFGNEVRRQHSASSFIKQRETTLADCCYAVATKFHICQRRCGNAS
jgi:hypothetical protein